MTTIGCIDVPVVGAVYSILPYLYDSNIIPSLMSNLNLHVAAVVTTKD